MTCLEVVFANFFSFGYIIYVEELIKINGLKYIKCKSLKICV